MNVLFDTCVIIDALQQRVPFCEEANQLFFAVGNQIITGYISAKSLTDIYYLTHKNLHNEKDTRTLLKSLLSVFYLLDTTSNDCFNALSSPMKDYEDAIMAETAKREKVDCIVTRNVKDYSDSGIRVFTPQELLAVINADAE